MKKVAQTLSRFIAILMMVFVFVPALLAAPTISPEVRTQVLGIITILLPFIIEQIKKLKFLKKEYVPFVPLVLGALLQVTLALTGIVPLPIVTAVAVGMGVGGVGSSGYDCYKKIKPMFTSTP